MFYYLKLNPINLNLIYIRNKKCKEKSLKIEMIDVIFLFKFKLIIYVEKETFIEILFNIFNIYRFSNKYCDIYIYWK